VPDAGSAAAQEPREIEAGRTETGKAGTANTPEGDQEYTIYCSGLASRTERVVSPIIRLRSDEAREIIQKRVEQAWKEYARTNATFPEGWDTGCSFRETYVEMETPGYSTNVGTRSEPVIQRVRQVSMPDGWYRRESLIAGNVPSNGNSGHILIEDKKPTQASAAQLAELRLQAQREYAAKAAKAAAESARNNADIQAKIAKAVEEARKRGNKQ
jgi:hypothetical protein